MHRGAALAGAVRHLNERVVAFACPAAGSGCDGHKAKVFRANIVYAQ